MVSVADRAKTLQENKIKRNEELKVLRFHKFEFGDYVTYQFDEHNWALHKVNAGEEDYRFYPTFGDAILAGYKLLVGDKSKSCKDTKEVIVALTQAHDSIMKALKSLNGNL